VANLKLLSEEWPAISRWLDEALSLAIYRAELGPGHVDTLRCAVLAAWLEAWDKPVDADKEKAFVDAAKAYAAAAFAGSASHAELALLGADLHERAGRTRQAGEERAAAAEAWRVVMKRDWKPPLVLLH
jgi:hypothetical protein